MQILDKNKILSSCTRKLSLELIVFEPVRVLPYPLGPRLQVCLNSVGIGGILGSFSLHARVLFTFPTAGGVVIAGDSLRIVLHTAHLGYDSMSRRAHDSTFWPVMTKEIRGVAKKCEA